MGIKIGVIGAMQVEIDLLVSQLEDKRTTNVADFTFFEGILGTTPVAVMRCGVGKVNAALCTQALCNRFEPTHIINTGVAGALDPSLEVGDLVISTDLVQHDMDVTGLGYAPGVTPELDDGGLRGKLAFDADEHLRQTVIAAAAEVAPGITVLEGRIASGDLFVCTPETRNRIIDTFGALCCEMEGAAIAQACWRNQIPFVVARVISDKADDTSTTEYRQKEQETAEQCAAIVKRAIELLSAA